MYGMVNQAIKDLVVTSFGQTTWEAICKQVGLSDEDFVFMQYYPDKLTYDLVGAASSQLQLSPSDVLREFGKHWVLYTAKEGYGPIMDLFGADFKSCLKNLNSLHARMGMTMPQLTPPRFTFEEVDPKTYIIGYHSRRPGLCPMVVGLLEGLAKKYQNKATVELISAENETEKSFRVKLEAA